MKKLYQDMTAQELACEKAELEKGIRRSRQRASSSI